MVPSQATYQNHRVVGGRLKKSPGSDRWNWLSGRNLCFSDSDVASPGNNIREPLNWQNFKTEILKSVANSWDFPLKYFIPF